MTRAQAIPYVSFVVDDAGSGRKLHADLSASVREAGKGFEHASKLVGWQCGFEPMFVAVHSYLDVALDDDEAEEMAIEYLEECHWFAVNSPREADYIIA